MGKRKAPEGSPQQAVPGILISWAVLFVLVVVVVVVVVVAAVLLFFALRSFVFSVLRFLPCPFPLFLFCSLQFHAVLLLFGPTCSSLFCSSVICYVLLRPIIAAILCL